MAKSWTMLTLKANRLADKAVYGINLLMPGSALGENPVKPTRDNTLSATTSAIKYISITILRNHESR